MAADDRANPLYEWALDHHEPHFGAVPGVRETYLELTTRFEAEVGQPVAEGLVKALWRVT